MDEKVITELRQAFETWREHTTDAQVNTILTQWEDHYPAGSPLNALLVAVQFPAASDIRTYLEWRAVGREPKHGEHSIKVFTNGGAKVHENDARVTVRQYLRLLHLFDITQTVPISTSKTNRR